MHRKTRIQQGHRGLSCKESELWAPIWKVVYHGVINYNELIVGNCQPAEVLQLSSRGRGWLHSAQSWSGGSFQNQGP